MIRLTSSGSTAKTDKFLRYLKRMRISDAFIRGGEKGIAALASATPIDSGLTASSWEYEIIKDRNGYTLSWYNTNVNDGVQVAILLQYGHGTGTGGYVAGTDYINPAIRPIFDQIADELWEEVRNA